MEKLKHLRLILLILLFGCVGFLSLEVYQTEKEKRLIKDNLIELSKIKYGLFSVDEWKQILSKIIANKIEDFNLVGDNREKMRVEISTLLYKQISDIEKQYYKEKGQTFFGSLQSGIAAITDTFGELKKNIPTFTEEILDFMNKPKNSKAMRDFIIKKLDDYADKTFSKIDYSMHDQILHKYNFKNRNDAISGLNAKIESMDKQGQPYKIGLLIIAALSGLWIILFKKISKNEYLIFTMICFSLLVTGLLLPMIEIDARISNISFSLLGESVSFQDQILYYKSKSILQVVQLMMTQERFDLLFVGILVFTFSVLFPLSKLISSVIYIYSTKQKSNKFIRFIIFKTGKWSMADVMVIAIFMAYIGFTGIITEQLKQIENITQNFDIFTTNKSSLMTGFFSFTSFAILSLLIAQKLQFEFNAGE